jgi:hypothetical protein
VTRLRSGAQSVVPPAGPSLSQQVAGEVGRMREALAHLIEFSGMSRREVEQRLCQRGCGTDLGRLLKGRLDLKMKHVLALCRVLELEPLEFVQIALRPRPGQRSPLLRRLEALLPYARPEAAPPAPRLETPDVADLLHRARDLAEQLSQLMQEAARLATPEGGPRPAPSDGRSRSRAAGTPVP